MLSFLNGVGKASAPTTPPEPPVSSSGIAVGTPLTVIGDSITYGDFRCKAYPYWLNLALSGRLLFPQTVNRGNSTVYGGNCGVSGDSTAQIAARAPTFNTHNGVYILLTGENDTSGVSDTDQQGSFDTIFTELSAAEKIYVIPFAETKSVDASAPIQTRNATNLAWLRANAGSTYPNVEIFPDSVWDNITLHDGMGGAGPDSPEGTHPNNYGAFKLANNIFSFMSSDLESGDAFDLTSGFTNLYAANFSGTSGTVDSDFTGSVASGLQLVANNMTGLSAVASKGTLNAADSQILTITGTSGASVPEIYLREVITHNYAVDGGILMIGNIKVTASDGSSDPVGLQAIGLEAAYGKHIFGSRYSPSNEGNIPFAFEGVFMNAAETHGSTMTSWAGDLVMRLSPSTSVDIRFEISNVRMFDMNNEGI